MGFFSNNPSFSNFLDSSAQVDPQPGTHSLLFDGVDEYLTLGDDPAFSFGDGSNDSPFSFSVWLKLGANQPNATGILTKYVGASEEFQVRFFTGTNTILLFLEDKSNGDVQFLIANENFGAGTYKQLTVTYDGGGGANAADGLNIYYNAVNKNSGIVKQANYVAMENDSGDLEIGRLAGFNNFTGRMYDPTLWNVELSSLEVTELYNLGTPISSLTHSQRANITFYYPINSSTDPTIVGGIKDASGNGHNATGVNMEIGDVDIDIP